MSRYGIGPAEAATTIVREIVPTLPKRARIGLIGLWEDERQQIKHLADRLRKRVWGRDESTSRTRTREGDDAKKPKGRSGD